jgi:hypothetical protein
MGPFEMVTIIVIVSVAAGLYKAHLNRKPTGPDPQQEARIARLEERVKALEAIVTDGGYELRQKFRELEHG